MDCSLLDFSVHGVFQGWILEWWPLPPPGDLPDPGVKPTSLAPPALQADSLPLRHLGGPVWGDIAPKYCQGWFEEHMPMFSSRHFMTLGLTFKSLIHFEFSFCVCCKKVVQFYLLLLHRAVQFFQHNLLKRLKPMYILASFVINNWSHEHGFISGLSFCSIYPYVYFCANIILFWLQLCNIVWNQLCFYFSRLLWLFRIFNFL